MAYRLIEPLSHIKLTDTKIDEKRSSKARSLGRIQTCLVAL